MSLRSAASYPYEQTHPHHIHVRQHEERTPQMRPSSFCQLLASAECPGFFSRQKRAKMKSLFSSESVQRYLKSLPGEVVHLSKMSVGMNLGLKLYPARVPHAENRGSEIGLQ